MAKSSATWAPRAISHAFCQGYERLAAGSDLLDRINVFPVADADTGANLKISLAPLRRPETPTAVKKKQLAQAATGNSGNIACAFMGELILSETLAGLCARIATSRNNAKNSVMDPQPGTMLTVFDALADFFHGLDGFDTDDPGKTESIHAALVRRLEAVIIDTPNQLPALKQAGVVDAGALGMFIFFEACFAFLMAPNYRFRPVTDIFPSGLFLSRSWDAKPHPEDRGHCISLMMTPNADVKTLKQEIQDCGKRVVLTRLENQVKVHLHTDDQEGLRGRLSALGTVTQWSASPIFTPAEVIPAAGSIHIMTDAAGSMAREDAKSLGVTLLDSYIVIGDQVYPETCVDPDILYAAMRQGIRATTAQASVFERHQSYQNVIGRFDAVIYLCVGSVYTGNFQVARQWGEASDPDRRLQVVDTGTASGRLGILALTTARFARQGGLITDVLAFYRKALDQSREVVFLDTLKYLAAGGRISRTRGFFGDLFHLKPVISPFAEGAAKVGMVRTQKEQLNFAINHLDKLPENGRKITILLQYTDNRKWVESIAAPAVAAKCPHAELLIRPLSLTSGVHMGPGTWAMADVWTDPDPMAAPTKEN